MKEKISSFYSYISVANTKKWTKILEIRTQKALS